VGHARNDKLLLNKKGENEIVISKKKLCRPAIFVPPQELTCSGSKGIISAREGTPKDIGAKVTQKMEFATNDRQIFFHRKKKADEKRVSS
jgi:hypothetical protein